LGNIETTEYVGPTKTQDCKKSHHHKTVYQNCGRLEFEDVDISVPGSFPERSFGGRVNNLKANIIFYGAKVL
jgi:hypothetical protein